MNTKAVWHLYDIITGNQFAEPVMTYVKGQEYLTRVNNQTDNVVIRVDFSQALRTEYRKWRIVSL